MLDGIHPGWLWIAAAAILAVAELIAPGVFLVWIAAAAGLTGMVALLVGVPIAWQLILFALFCVVSVLLGRYVYQRAPGQTSDPLLNDRAARLVGRTVVVSEAISEGAGRVRVGDTIWSARGHDASVGTVMTVIGAESNCLIVDAMTPAEAAALDRAQPR